MLPGPRSFVAARRVAAMARYFVWISDPFLMTTIICRSCGLVQAVPDIPPRHRAVCCRCGAAIRRHPRRWASNRLTFSLSLSALILFPLAITLPIVTVERFGHLHRASIIDGVSALIGAGHFFVGLVVLLCSIVFPVGKLLGLLILCAGGNLLRHEHRGLTFRLIELTGRWGMLDVLLVAILVAVLKIGDFVDVSPGPAALAFTSCVLLSLLAAATFNPAKAWTQASEQPA